MKKLFIKIGLIVGGIIAITLTILSLMKKKEIEEIDKMIADDNKGEKEAIDKEIKKSEEVINKNEEMIKNIEKEKTLVDHELVIIDEKKKRLKKKKFTDQEIEKSIKEVEDELFKDSNS